METAMRKRHILLIFICLTLQVGMEPEKWQQETLKNKFTCKVCILHQHPAKKWGYLVFPKKDIYQGQDMEKIEINRIYIPIYIRILPRILYPANISCKRIYSGIYILGDIYPTQVWSFHLMFCSNSCIHQNPDDQE